MRETADPSEEVGRSRRYGSGTRSVALTRTSITYIEERHSIRRAPIGDRVSGFVPGVRTATCRR
jgi:hypothetical protein